MEGEDHSTTLISWRDRDESSMIVTLEPGGLITIQDYSHQNERRKLLELLKEFGVDTKLVLETLMDFHDIPGHKQTIYQKLAQRGEGEKSNG
jgi:hypothetical protein